MKQKLTQNLQHFLIFMIRRTFLFDLINHKSKLNTSMLSNVLSRMVCLFPNSLLLDDFYSIANCTLKINNKKSLTLIAYFNSHGISITSFISCRCKKQIEDAVNLCEFHMPQFFRDVSRKSCPALLALLNLPTSRLDL